MSKQQQQQQQRSLYEDSRVKLCEKMTQNIYNVGSLMRQIIKTSHINDIVGQSAKNFATQTDVHINNDEINLKKFQSTIVNLNQQLIEIEQIIDQHYDKF